MTTPHLNAPDLQMTKISAFIELVILDDHLMHLLIATNSLNLYGSRKQELWLCCSFLELLPLAVRVMDHGAERVFL